MKNKRHHVFFALFVSALLLVATPHAFVFAAGAAPDKEGALAELSHRTGGQMTQSQAQAYCDKPENGATCMEIGREYHLLSPNADTIKAVADSVKTVCEKSATPEACSNALGSAIAELTAMQDPLATKVAEHMSVNKDLMALMDAANAVCTSEKGPDSCLSALQELLPKLQAGKFARNPEAKRMYTLTSIQIQISEALARVNHVCDAADAVPASCLQALTETEAFLPTIEDKLPSRENVQLLMKSLSSQRQALQIVADAQSVCVSSSKGGEDTQDQGAVCLAALTDAESKLEQLGDNPVAQKMAQKIQEQISSIESARKETPKEPAGEADK